MSSVSGARHAVKTSIMRRFFSLFSLLPVLGLAAVTCKKPDGTANGAGWHLAQDGFGYRGDCGPGVVRPVWYVFDTTGYSPTDTTAFDRDHQAVWNDAWLGDKVLYTAGQEFVAGDSRGPRITKRHNGSGTLEATTTKYAKLPPSGTRITP